MSREYTVDEIRTALGQRGLLISPGEARAVALALGLPLKFHRPQRVRWAPHKDCIEEIGGPILFDFSTLSDHSLGRAREQAPEFARRYNAVAEVLELRRDQLAVDRIMLILCEGGQL